MRQFKRKDLKYIQGGETKRLGDRTKVTLNVPAGSSFRDMRENNKVVVEILAPSKSTGVAAPATAADPAAEPRPQPAGPALMQIADPPLSPASVRHRSGVGHRAYWRGGELVRSGRARGTAG